MAVAQAGAAVAPDNVGSNERERGTEGSEEEAVVPVVEREEG